MLHFQRLSKASALAPACIIVFLLLTFIGTKDVGVTFDEPGHIVSGYAYWKKGDFRINAESGALSGRLLALPLLPATFNFAGENSRGWNPPNSRDLGIQFLYESGNDFGAILWRARAAVAVFGAAVLWLVWQWARGLFGRRSAAVAIVLAAFSPTLLAHGALATTDMIISFWLLGALSAVWLLWHHATAWRLILGAFAVGAALTAKMSGGLLIPMLALLLLIRCLRGVPLRVDWAGHTHWIRTRTGIALAAGATIAVIASVSFFLIWAVYDFRFAMAPGPAGAALQPHVSWPALLAGESPAQEVLQGQAVTLKPGRVAPPVSSLTQRVVVWARERRLLPEAYLWGLTFTYQASRERPSFFLGECYSKGRASFFPVAFLLKSTPPELIFFFAGVVVLGATAWSSLRSDTARRRLRWVYRASPLFVLFVGYWVVAIASGLNIGHRHLLPIYPVVFIFAGAGLHVFTRLRFRWMNFAAVLLSWQVLAAMTVRPDYLSYFTPFAGGTDRGWRHMVDSSYDWGQGLPAFKRWVQEVRSSGDKTPVFLTYFGSDSTRARHIDVTRFADWRDYSGPRAFPAVVQGGWFAISATHFHGVYLGLCGPWTQQNENRYATTLALLPKDAATVARFTASERATWRANGMVFEVLQFGRLRHFLQNRAPDKIIGASILLFRLSDADVQLAAWAPLDEVNRHIESKRRQ